MVYASAHPLCKYLRLVKLTVFKQTPTYIEDFAAHTLPPCNFWSAIQNKLTERKLIFSYLEAKNFTITKLKVSQNLYSLFYGNDEFVIWSTEMLLF